MGVARGNIKTTIVADGEQQYYQVMNKLYKQQKTLRSEAAALTSTYDKNTKSQQKLKDSAQNLTKQIEVQKKIVEGYEEELEKEIKSSGEASVKSEELATKYNNAAAKLNNLEKQLESVNQELKNNESVLISSGKKMEDFGEKLDAAGNKITGVGKKVSVASAAILSAAYKATDAAVDYESAFTGVRKTVDATEEEFEQLYDAILDLSTEIPVTAEEIAGVAEIAGQLGIQKKNLLEFSEVMLELGVSAENLNAEEAASSLAKFTNIVGMSQDKIENLGSAIVDLGNNYATTEADIINMAMRLAGAGKQVHLSEGDILGLATALSSVGIEAEMGGSAISKAMVRMSNAVEMSTNKLPKVLQKSGMSLRGLQLLSANNSKAFKQLADSIGMTSTELNQIIKAGADLENFSKISGMSAEEFKNAWKNDAAGALSSFIQGLGNAEEKGESAITMLSEMGLTEVRLRDSLLRAANAGDLFNNAMETGNKAFEENIALQEEADKRFATLESKIQMCKNMINKVAVQFGEEFMPYVEKGCEWLEKLANNFSDLSDEEKDQIIKIGAVVAAAGPLILILGKTTSAAGTLISTGGKLIKKIGEIKTGEAVSGLKKFSQALVDVTGYENNAEAGTISLSKSFATNAALFVGIVAVTAVIAGLVAAYKSLVYGSKETRDTMNGLGEAIEDFKNKMESATGNVESVKSALNFDDKDTELENKYQEIQDKIVNIATTASDERRILTQKERDELSELFDQLNDITEKEIELFTDTQDAIKTIIEAENDMTEERAASILSQTQNVHDEAISKIESYYQSQIVLLNEKYSTEDQRRSEEYQKQLKDLQSWRDKEIAAANESVSTNSNMISQKMLQNSGGYEAMLSAFEKYNADMAVAEEESRKAESENMNKSLGASLGFITDYYLDRKKLNDNFSKDFLKQNQEVVGNYLVTIDSMLQGGETLSAENQKIVEAIITAYGTLPKSASKPWKETLDNIKAAIEDADLKGKGKSVGEDFNKGVKVGLENNEVSIYKKVDEIGGNMFTHLRRSLEINSPSRKGEYVGEMTDDGVIVGLKNKEEDVYKKASEIGNKLIDNMQADTVFNPDIEIPKLTAQYKASLANSGAMQAVYHQAYVNNNSNANNYYSTHVAGNQAVNEEIKSFKIELLSVLNSAFADSNNFLTERQAGRIIKKCLKHVSM